MLCAPRLVVANPSLIEKMSSIKGVELLDSVGAFRNTSATYRSHASEIAAMLAAMLRRQLPGLARGGGGGVLPGVVLAGIAGELDVMQLSAFARRWPVGFGAGDVPGLAAAVTGIGYPHAGYPHAGGQPAGRRGGGGVTGAGVLPGDAAGAGVIGAGLAAALDNLGTALRAAGRYDDAVTAHQAAVEAFGFLAARAAVYGIRDVSGLVAAANAVDSTRGQHPARRADRGRTASGTTLPGAVQDQMHIVLPGHLGRQGGAGGVMTTAGIVQGGWGPAVGYITDLDAGRAAGPGTAGMAAAGRSPGQRDGAGGTGAGLAAALDNLGTALRAAGRYDDAVTAHETAVTVFGQLKDGHGEAMALENLEKTRAEQLASSGGAF